MNVDRSDSIDADDAFSLLGSEVRLRIVRALGDAWSPEDREPLSFSALRRAVDVRDSGRFDYHLRQLLGAYVEQTDDGYLLTYPGVKVYQSIKAGTFNERVTIEPFELDVTCFDCEGPLVARYQDLLFKIECGDCDRRYYNYYLPPGSITDATRDGVLAVLDRALRRDVASAAAGLCPACDGEMAATVGPDAGYIFGESGRSFEAHVAFDCHLCGAHTEATVGEALIDHPALVSFFYQRGTDLSDRYLWTLPFVHESARTELRSADPVRVGVTAACDGDELTMVVDGSLDVVDVESPETAPARPGE